MSDSLIDMDDDQIFDEISQESGREPYYYTEGNFSGYSTSGHGAYYGSNQASEYEDEIENSSPSPPERFAAFRSESYGRLGTVVHEDQIVQYEEGPRYHNQRGNQWSSHDSLFSYGGELNTQISGSPPDYNIYEYPTPHDHQEHYYGESSSGYDALPVKRGTQFQAPEPQEQYSRGANPRNSHGIRLRPVSELPDIYRGVFKFGVFNAVQSMCFDAVLHSDENLVISAPTGSGKTVLFELSVLRMVIEAGRTGKAVKCVYVAPTKALCSERYRDWTAKFDGLGIKCCELTGDTVTFGKGAWGEARNASIIITTGEKWDSLTRHWRDHSQILSQIQLFLVDEVHILNESRGSTLEVIVSRMKTRGSAVRFVLVSATVPNIQDIASWIGSTDSHCPAGVFEFGEEFRPCRLTRHVYGIPRSKTQNDFVYAKSLDYRLFSILQQHATNKPILIFASTRKGVFSTADQLAKEYQEATEKKKTLPWSRPTKIDYAFQNKRLADFAMAGIGAHHAGLTIGDRRAVEDLYLKGILRVIVSTSTLAVGVNLPAHTVVIKGVHIYQNNVSVEYSDLDIMQMLGRAGRPQFDKDGVAIILCETELEEKYKCMLQGKTILESCLHLNLSEHINSEVGLGTITSINSAKGWLRNSFLYRRIQKNPMYYAVGKEDGQTWEDRVDDLVTQSVIKLQNTGLIEYDSEGDGRLGSTEYGDIMSKFYIRQSTMGLILALPPRASMREILETISAAEEFTDSKLRSSEKTIYNKLRVHNDIRFSMKKIETTSDKVLVLIQAVLGGISLNASEYRSGDSQPQLEALSIFRHIARIARVIVEVAIVKKHGAQIKHGLELIRCFTAKAWEDRPIVLRQIKQIGEKSLKVLAENGITSLEILRKQDFVTIEALLNRRSPFGLEVLAAANEFPSYFVNISEVQTRSGGGQMPVEIDLSVECGLVKPVGTSKMKKQKGHSITMTGILTLTSDLDFIDFRRIGTTSLQEPKTFEITAQLTKPSQAVVVYATSETIAGVTVSQTYKPMINAMEYPTLNTRPLNSTDMDLLGFEDDPDFWNMSMDDGDEQNIPIKDLTKPQPSKNKVQSGSVSKQTDKKVSSSSVLQAVDRLLLDAKKRPNGTYECNHHCANKTKCRHLCCRDGLLEPPRVQKKQNVTTAVTDISLHESFPSNDGIRVKPKLNKPRPDRRLEQLNSLHERTDSLKLPEGQRLKLDSADDAKGKRKRRPVPNFDIDFVDLADGDSLSAAALDTNMDMDNCDNDDPPALYELLKPSKQTASSETLSDYSNSNLETLIRDLPMDDGKKAVAGVRTKYKTPAARSSPLSVESSPASITEQHTGPATKRPRLDSPSIIQNISSPFTYKSPRSQKMTNQQETSLARSTQDDDKADFSQDAGDPLDEDFYQVYDSVYILPDTPDLTSSTCTSDTNELRSSGSNLFIQDQPSFADVRTEKKTENVPNCTPMDLEDTPNGDLYEDQYNDFKAWFLSGAVEIVEHMD